jgi:glycosyltransferase involved in cell wall biosynthesis
MEKISKISLIIPTYKQEKIIVREIDQLHQILKQLPFNFEIIVVVDGFVDDTYSILKKLRRPYLKVFGYEENKGKGFAVRYGVMQGSGDIIGFMDGGTDISASSITMVLNHFLWYNADIVIGSKLHPVSQVKYPFTRKILSWGYRTLIRILFGLRIRDSQVGLKLFKKEVVADVFPRLLVKRFAFDIEVLAVAYSRGFRRIYEAPVKLSFNDVSSIIGGNFWKAIFYMMWDTAAVFYRLKILNYYNKLKVTRK